MVERRLSVPGIIRKAIREGKDVPKGLREWALNSTESDYEQHGRTQRLNGSEASEG